MSVTDTAPKFPPPPQVNRLLDAMRRRTMNQKYNTTKNAASNETTYEKAHVTRTTPYSTKRF